METLAPIRRKLPPMRTATAMAPARRRSASTQQRIFFQRPLLPSAFVTYSFSPLRQENIFKFIQIICIIIIIGGQGAIFMEVISSEASA